MTTEKPTDQASANLLAAVKLSTDPTATLKAMGWTPPEQKINHRYGFDTASLAKTVDFLAETFAREIESKVIHDILKGQKTYDYAVIARRYIREILEAVDRGRQIGA